MLKNNRYLKALKGEELERPPVWMMRQAGRFLPEFRELKNKYDFFTRCQTPELAANITMMPIRRFPLDAAILFSDILVVPQAMGMNFQMKENYGPYLENTIDTLEKVQAIEIPDVKHELNYVYQAIDFTLSELNQSIPLIGFAGSPWTILCYAVEGKGSKTFDVAKGFCFSNPKAAHLLLQKITETTILYLKEKIKHGVSAVQLFDSWGGLLSPKDYQEFSWKYLNQIVEALADEIPVVVFGKGCWFALNEMSSSRASALGVDWTVSADFARKETNNSITLQGNFDPAKLLATPEIIKKETIEMIDSFGTNKYIANLGHGILPNIPIENAQTFVETVVNYPNLK